MLAVYSIAFVAALAVILYSADRLLIAAIALSHRYRVPPLIVGAVIIGCGTSSPELAVSISSALNHESLMAIGNAFGSNIANLGLVAGSAALFTGIHTDRNVLKYRFPLVIAASLLPGLLILNFTLSRMDAALMLFVLGGILYALIRPFPQSIASSSEIEDESVHQAADRINQPELRLLISLAALLIGCEIAVRTAITIAETLDISKLIIGLTIIAIGTSLPELAAALVSVYRKQHSIAIGNIIGSNIFNSLGVLGFATLIHPTNVPAELLYRDFIVMFGITLLVWLFFALPQKHCMGRKEGVLLLAGFSAYLVWLYFSATA